MALTDQAYVNPAAVSTELGSVTELPRLIGVPSRLLVKAPVIEAVGATLVTVITSVAGVLVAPSLSSAVNVTVYVPLSSGVKLKLAPLPLLTT